MIKAIKESDFTLSSCIKSGLNQKYKNFFYNGNYKNVFSASNLKTLIALQSIYDEEGTGLSYKNSKDVVGKWTVKLGSYYSYVNSLEDVDYELSNEMAKNGVIFVYLVVGGKSVYVVTPYSVLNGLLVGIKQIWTDAIKIGRFNQERAAIIDGLKYIEVELQKAQHALTTCSIIEAFDANIAVDENFAWTVYLSVKSIVEYKKFVDHVSCEESPYALPSEKILAKDQLRSLAEKIRIQSEFADVNYASSDKILAAFSYIKLNKEKFLNDNTIAEVSERLMSH